MRGFGLAFRMALVGLLAVALTGCFALVNTAGSGRTVTKDLPFTNFTNVEGSHTFQLNITRGDNFAVQVTADDNLWDRLNVTQNGQTLHLGLQPGSYTNTHLQANITMPALNGLALSGASRGTLQGFTTPVAQLKLGASGASQISGQAQGGATVLDLSGASKANLQGGSQTVQVLASGASSADLSQFPVDRADVQLSGASNATMSVKSNLDYDLSGASNLVYTGSPSIGRSQTSGASSATHR